LFFTYILFSFFYVFFSTSLSWSHDMGRELHACFFFLCFTYFLFSFSTDFLFYQVNQGWLASHSPSYMLVILIRIDSNYFFCSFFLPNFILLYLIGWELSYIVCSHLQKYLFLMSLLSLCFLIWSICYHDLFFLLSD